MVRLSYGVCGREKPICGCCESCRVSGESRVPQVRSNPKTFNLDAMGAAKGTQPGFITGRRRAIVAPDLGRIRSLTARVIVAELWLAIGVIALLSNLSEGDFALVIAVSTLFALLPSLVWICDPIRVVARYVLSVGFVAQAVLLAAMSLQTEGPITYGVFAFSVVLLAQIAGFICWRSLLVAGGLLIASTIVVDFWLASSGTAGALVLEGDRTSELLVGLLPLWLLALGVLLPMTYRVERMLGEAHASRLAALEAMTSAVEEARSVAFGKRPNAKSAAAALNLRQAVLNADVANTRRPDHATPADDVLSEEQDLARQLAFGRGMSPDDAADGKNTDAQYQINNSVHRQQQILARALENRDPL